MNVTFLLGLWLLSGGLPAEDAVVEPSSGVSFPLFLGGDVEGEPRQSLLGRGARTRTLFRVQVYAVALYADTAALQRSGDTVAAIRAGRVDRTLRLVTTRDIDGGRMRDAFTKAMRPRFVKAIREGGLIGNEDHWRAFTSSLAMNRLSKGTELRFSCDRQGRLQAFIDQIALPAIDSEALCFALFDVYIGPEPISRELAARLTAGGGR